MRKGQTETGNYKVTVLADNSGKFVGNDLRFDTAENAADYATDLSFRWLAVKAWRVVQIDTGATVDSRTY